MTSNHLFTGVRVDSCLLQDLVELKSKMNILRATGIASLGGRMAFMAVDRRDLDRDRLHETNKRVPDSGIDRVRLIFDRRYFIRQQTIPFTLYIHYHFHLTFTFTHFHHSTTERTEVFRPSSILWIWQDLLACSSAASLAGHFKREPPT